ncbi:Mlo-related protein [Parasponia andersonii]|uniref:MLO-like protein n=1 Tax=Parasponia andersonii TaxID=3476 RepID=A0A2P5CC07_PARAD|nr:Mlo-related protein [Parasponia andersonii]
MAEYERSLEETPTWAVAVVCFVLVVISIIIEHVIHLIGAWLKSRHKRALYEALEKIKAELMLLGFISLLLTVLQGEISDICIPKSVAETWHPCKSTKKGDSDKGSENKGRRLLEFSDSEFGVRRSLASKGYDKCSEKARKPEPFFPNDIFFRVKGQVALVSKYGIHQLHIFIFVLALSHVLYCITTLALGRTKMRKWKVWEDETKRIEYMYNNDPERFRFTRDTSFGRRHLNFWSQSPFSLWIVCFFRQFFGSVTKVDYLTLRHGFIMAHLAPESETRFDFQNYISRSLEEDFVVVVGITPIIWFFAVIFLLSNTYGIYSYLWLPFLPLIIILLVGAKLQVIITKMGLRIQERGDVVKGAPLVQPGDDLFWFGRPRFMLFLIHFVLFQNAFQLAFFAWSTYEFSINSCFHNRIEDVIIRVSMGVLIQVLCSYVTLPLYALVTQMGSTMKPTIFNDRVAAALKNWHKSAKKNNKHKGHSEANSPFSSRPATPTYGMSPVHLLQNYRSTVNGYYGSPMASNVENDYYDPDEGSPSPNNGPAASETQGNNYGLDNDISHEDKRSKQVVEEPSSSQQNHEIKLTLSDFTFGK